VAFAFAPAQVAQTNHCPAGLIALALLHRRALSPNDVQGGRRASLVLQAAAAVLVLLLGVVLFANGVAERVIALL
jgi:hypothetical protein